MPAEHSSLIGGSIAERRENCLASYKLELAAPTPPSSKYANEGTMLHSVVERCVNEGIDPVKLTGYTEAGAKMTAGLAEELVRPALEALDALLDAYGIDEYDLITEARVAYKEFDGYGTCDLLISTSRHALLVDWKFGRGVMVNGGAGNTQLKFYAGAALETVPEFFEGDKEIVLAIIQPAKDEPLSHGTITREALDEYVSGMKRAVGKILADDVGDPTPGKWCRWCNAAPTCPAKRSQVEHALDRDPRSTSIDPVEFGEMLQQAEQVEDWAKSVRAAAYSALEQGKPIEGYKLVQRQRRRYWTDEERAVEALLTAGINDAFEQRKLISPAQAEKKVRSAGGNPKDLAEWIEARSAGLTIAPADDKRPAVFERGIANATPADLNLNTRTREKENSSND